MAVHTQKNDSPWYYSHAEKAKGVFLVAHGLNLNPLAMKPLVELLNNLGFHCYLLTLEGHSASRANAPDKHNISLASWLTDVDRAVSEIQSKYSDLPLLNLSYSLGAALSVLYEDIHASKTFSALVLLAPAIKLTAMSKLLKPIASIQQFNFSLPSFAPKRYRAFSFTPIAEYRALFELSKRLEKVTNRELLNSIPTALYLTPHDELVDFRDTQNWVSENSLSNWKISQIESEKRGILRWDHIIIDKDSLGEKGWSFLLNETCSFLEQNMFLSEEPDSLYSH